MITYSENSLIKYNLGSFRTFNEAQKYRSQIIRKYKGAFVKALKTMFQYSQIISIIAILYVGIFSK